MLLLAASFAAMGVLLAWPRSVRLPQRRADEGASRLLLLAMAVGIGFAIGGVTGVLIASAAAVLAQRRITGARARAASRRRADEERELPAVAGLLAALLASGATIEASVAALAESHRGALTPALQRVAAAMRLGAGADEAWRTGADTLAPIADAVRRSATTGAPAAALLADVVVDEQRRWRSRVEVAARSVGVRAIPPLVVCFLPAFLLVGVVPVIASIAAPLLS